MKIIEQNLVGKYTQDTCEDGIVITDNFIAVIDGSTSKTTYHFKSEMSNGQYCMKLIADYIRCLHAAVTLSEFCEGITKEIFNKYLMINIIIFNS
mgnify:CR=1 FL=1